MCETEAIDNNGVPWSAHDLLMDIRWNCEHCAARLDYEARKSNAIITPGGGVGGSPCRGCRLRKYGYGGNG